MDERIDRLVQMAELLLAANAELVAVVREQGEHTAALVQAVAMLLGEEAGTPLPDEDAAPERLDMDGNPY
jgi:hypothetical protein